jgi:hypothetical protein
MPDATAPEEKKPSFSDKMASRKFIITVIGMLANVLLGWKGSLPVNTAMTNVFYFAFAFMFAEGGVDAFAALGKSLGSSGIIPKLLPIIDELKTLKDSLKKKDGEE